MGRDTRFAAGDAAAGRGALLLVLLYAGACAPRGASGTYIALRELHLTGEDSRLRAVLAQRIDPGQALGSASADQAALPHYLHEAPSRATDLSVPLLNASAFTSGRRTEPKYLQDYALHSLILDLMRGSIYRLREKVKDLERVFTTYEKDPRFRIGYLFGALAQWEKEARAIHQHDKSQESELSVLRHLHYYEHILRRQVDVTHSLQLLHTLHHQTARRIHDHVKNLKALKIRYSNYTRKPQAG